ncbi:MAG: hypothetical protein CMI63_03250 [Parvularcula sp.]|uniref:hypothetical protein n=1 Tax=Hyphococcus sp. TaxID=2038636 RepID=UPI000C48AF26|nr:hypothetical protein [Parvularcula sp.]
MAKLRSLLFFGIMAAAACAAEKPSEITESVCEDVLSSFGVVPTTQQSGAERLEMLAVIKSEQETEFSEACSRFPGWSKRFESAYAAAQKQTSMMTGETAFENAEVIEMAE